MRPKLALVMCFSAAGLLFGPSNAQAATITAFELIEDTTCTTANLTLCADQIRDLRRERKDGANPSTIVTTDSIIEGTVASGGNEVDGNFGKYLEPAANNTLVDVQYTHVLSWLPTSTFLSGTLTILSYAVDGDNDEVRADNLVLGNLVADGGPTSVITTSGPYTVLVSSLTDGKLLVTVNKSNNDFINVFSSKLQVTYDDGTGGTGGLATPEPASLVLLGTGLLGGAWRMRKRRPTSV